MARFRLLLMLAGVQSTMCDDVLAEESKTSTRRRPSIILYTSRFLHSTPTKPTMQFRH